MDSQSIHLDKAPFVPSFAILCCPHVQPTPPWQQEVVADPDGRKRHVAAVSKLAVEAQGVGAKTI